MIRTLNPGLAWELPPYLIMWAHALIGNEVWYRSAAEIESLIIGAVAQAKPLAR